MELEDSLFPLLREVRIGIDPYDVFQDAEWALLIGAKPRGPGMERADLLDINGQIFAEQVSSSSSSSYSIIYAWTRAIYVFLIFVRNSIFEQTLQGKALNAVASRNVKVLVVGNPCNTK